MVNVRKKSKRATAKTKQTPECRLSSGLSGMQLNKGEGSSSVACEKTLFNSARESLSSAKTLKLQNKHYGSVEPKHVVPSKESVVFVIDKNSKPLMPTKSGAARRMLKSGIAKVVSRTPFVIKMLVDVRGYIQSIDAGLDVGAKNIGCAAHIGAKVLYASTTRTRQQEIKGKLDQRRMYRRTRRGRKLRYRMARFLNRGASIRIGLRQPSVRHVVDAHVREMSFVESILPCIKWHIETASFDIHAITNPEVTRLTYTKGPMHGFENTKAFVLHRDSYKCAKNSSHKGELHVHHIQFRSNGGGDAPDNLITLCKACHDELHVKKDAQKESLKLTTKAPARTREATIVSTVSAYLRKNFSFTETFGFETKLKRRILGFPKDHDIDALLATTAEGEIVDFPIVRFDKRMVSQGDYQQTSGAHSQQKIPTGKLFGFRKFDFIETSKGTGFVKGKRSSGYFAISALDGTSISDSVNVKKFSKRLAARKSVLIEIKQKESASAPLLKQGVSARKINET